MQDIAPATTNGVKRKADPQRPDFAESESSDDDMPLVRFTAPVICSMGYG